MTEDRDADHAREERDDREDDEDLDEGVATGATALSEVVHREQALRSACLGRDPRRAPEARKIRGDRAAATNEEREELARRKRTAANLTVRLARVAGWV
jgi:hypothetical protein